MRWVRLKHRYLRLVIGAGTGLPGDAIFQAPTHKPPVIVRGTSSSSSSATAGPILIGWAFGSPRLSRSLRAARRCFFFCCRLCSASFLHACVAYSSLGAAGSGCTVRPQPQAQGRGLPAKLVRNKLIVSVGDAIWQRQLHALRPQIVERLRKPAGSHVIQELEFQIALPRRAPQRAEARSTTLDAC
jgi:hypothetical protein